MWRLKLKEEDEEGGREEGVTRGNHARLWVMGLQVMMLMMGRRMGGSLYQLE
jgi:hypothetical protein